MPLVRGRTEISDCPGLALPVVPYTDVSLTFNYDRVYPLLVFWDIFFSEL